MFDQRARSLEGKKGLVNGIARVSLATDAARLITMATIYFDGCLHIMG